MQEYRLQVLGVVRIKAGRGKQILEYNYPRAPLRPEADRENLLYPDVFDEGRYTLAWGESAGSAYNSDAHRLLARRLIEDRGYQYAKGLTLQQEDQPIIEEMLYNGYKYLKDQRELSVNRERLTPDEVLAREAERIDRAKAERCRNVSCPLFFSLPAPSHDTLLAALGAESWSHAGYGGAVSFHSTLANLQQ